VLSQLALPLDLFGDASPAVIGLYRQRAATETLYESRRHPDATRSTLLAAFCLQRRAEITDSLIELLLHLIQRIGARAEKRVTKELLDELRGVTNKPRLLYQVAEAALAHPDETIRKEIFRVMSEEQCKAIVQEYKTRGGYHQQVYLCMRSSYRNHYRRMAPLLVNMLDIHSSNSMHQPVIRALELIKRYVDTTGIWYPVEEDVPIEGVIRPMWESIVLEKDKDGEQRINRVNDEPCVLEALRDGLRCRELWVAGANKYRNPDDDLPKDFAERRDEYYQALNQPKKAQEFIESLQQQMRSVLDSLDRAMPKLAPKVHLSNKNGGWIHLSPLEAQSEPKYLRKIKAEIQRRWGMTNLLDILKEADLRIDFTRHFKSPATRQVLDRETLQKRLLLCLYGMGTNTGIKRISMGDHGQTYQELLSTRRRYLHQEHLRAAIVDIANAIFQIRLPHIWGEGTTTCASDSTQFGAWDQNLLTEWHLRYGGKGVMVYWHVERRATCIYSQLKTCSSSEVAAMINGVLRHCTQMKVEKQFVDTHGQNEVAFGFCHLLGFQLMPRLKNIYAQRLARPETGKPEAYPNLQLILSKPIDWDLIREQYDQMIKYATALRLGTAETEAILRRFTETGVRHPTYRAFAELGRAIKTIFLCQYLQSEELRREIHEGLNVIENWNGANSFIFYGRSGDFATNRLDEQELAALSLHLLQICLVYTLSRDFVGDLGILQEDRLQLLAERKLISYNCSRCCSLWKVIVMAAFTLTQSEKDPSLFFVVGPDGIPASDINVFLLHLSHLGRSAYTLRSYAQGLAHFFDWLHRAGCQVDEVTPQVIEAYIVTFSLQAKGGACPVDPAKAGQINLLTRKAAPGRERQPRTINHRLSVLASFFAYRIQTDTAQGTASGSIAPIRFRPVRHHNRTPMECLVAISPGEESEENYAAACPGTFRDTLILLWPNSSSIQPIPGETKLFLPCCIAQGSELAIGASSPVGTAFSA